MVKRLIKSYRKRDGSRVKSHMRKTSKIVTRTIPTRFDDKAVKEVWNIYSEMEKLAAEVIPNPKRLAKLTKQLEKYPADLKQYVADIY